MDYLAARAAVPGEGMRTGEHAVTLKPGHARQREAAFLATLAELEQWLTGEQIPYAIFGSVAASAWIDYGTSLNFNRPGARDPAERVPDIDLLVPRASLTAVKHYASVSRRGAFPVSIDTFWSECWIDFRAGAERSYLTHRRLRLPVPTELFSPCTVSLLGQDITVLDPRTLLSIYGAVGVVRRKDAPWIAGLVQVIASGSVVSRFTEEDCQVFSSFMLARRRRYPFFFAAKRAWVRLLDALPPGVSQALTHHVQLRANEVFRLLNRRHGRRSGRCQEQPGVQPDVV